MQERGRESWIDFWWEGIVVGGGMMSKFLAGGEKTPPPPYPPVGKTLIFTLALGFFNFKATYIPCLSY